MTTKPQRVIFLPGRRLYLRPVEQADIECLRRWVNNPEIRQFINRQVPLSQIEEQKWQDNRATGPAPSDITLAIVLRKGDRLIGSMGLHRIDWINRNAFTGALIGEKECQDKGYGSEAKALVLRYCFDTLGMHRISSNVLANNARSRAYLLRSGYREEGVLREFMYRDGKWVDDIQMGLLASEWRELQAKQQKKSSR